MTTAGTSLLLRSATKYLGVSKYHAMAEVGPSHAESSPQRSAASFASFSQPLERVRACEQEVAKKKGQHCEHVTVRRIIHS